MRLSLARLLLSLGARLMTRGRPASVVVALEPEEEPVGVMARALQHQRLRLLSMVDGLLFVALREGRSDAVPRDVQ